MPLRLPPTRHDRILLVLMMLGTVLIIGMALDPPPPPQKWSFVPPDIPTYPHQTRALVTEAAVNSSGFPYTRMTFATIDPPEAVLAWYRRELAATAWQSVTVISTQPSLSYDDTRGCPIYHLKIHAERPRHVNPDFATEVTIAFLTGQCRDQYVPTFTPTQP